MVYYGRRRYNYRRKASRGSRNLSTRNIFNNKGARSQAAQIYRLNRKVNSVYRQCKPELKIIQTVPQSHTFTSYEYDSIDPSNITIDFTSPNNPANVMSIDMPSQGDGDNEIVGNVCNLKDMTVYLNVNYDQIRDSRLNSIPSDFSDQAHIRFLFFMSKIPNDDVISPDMLFEVTPPNVMNPSIGNTTLGSYSPGYKMNTVLPLLEGTASRFTILKDIRTKVGVMNPDKQLKIKIPLSRYAKYIQNSYTIFGKCQIYCLAITSGLEMKGVTNSSSEYVYAVPRIITNWFTKIAYTDP